MNWKKYLCIIIAMVVAFGVVYPDEAYAKRKTKTTQNTKKKKKKRTSSSSKKGASGTQSAAPKEKVCNDSLTLLVNEALVGAISSETNPGGLRVNQVKPDNSSHAVSVQLNENFTYMSVNRDLVTNLENVVKEVLPDSLSGYRVHLNVGNKAYSSYIAVIDLLPEKYRKNIPFVVAADPYVNPRKGMEGDIVALWHSHGRYYSGNGWSWQRPFLFQTAEDIYTMSYVLPFLTPMLENAGAYVMLPRERDVNANEVIIDNDLNPEGEIYSEDSYFETNGTKKWYTGELEGFIYDIPDFRDTENPFENGTYREVETIRSGKVSRAEWFADIPEDGEYAVYVSYKTLPNSTEDARYTVNYSGGSKDFVVNQTMGGGTWIYLGTFPFKAGYNESLPAVSLSNRTEKGGNTVVTADAVKIGGGMGNISRSPRRSDVNWGTESVQETAQVSGDDLADDESEEDDETDEDDLADDAGSIDTPAPSYSGPAPRFTTSGLPRFLEGARYWLHWAGFPERVYSSYDGGNDYKDDYTSRGRWVNYLAGGSRVLPEREGLNIPVDISFALHSDAGLRGDDTYVGTLGIYFTDGGRSYADGTPRSNSRILTDMIMRQVVGDIRQNYEPNWTRRSMWDKSYAEAHTAEVPTTLLELLSHQNFADMQYGLDPTFRFSVSRSIYKAMGRFIAERKGREFVVQPLPVQEFMITRERKGTYKLSWQPTPDPQEPTAKPTKYIIMERVEGNLGFKKVGETTATSLTLKVEDNRIHSVYIIAANEGGVSFPSEVLAFREGSGKPVLIVNGFTRVSGPASFSSGGRAGFLAEEDFGVPYKYDISFGGYQQEFSRNAGDRFGQSGSNYVSTVVGGNTFDYPAVHGAAIASTGRGFVSCSLQAVEEGHVRLNDYATVDLILGKQKLTDVGGSAGKKKNLYAAFPAALRERLAEYVEKGGQLIVSGQNIASELYSEKSDVDSKVFAEVTLGIAESSYSKSHSGRVKVTGLNDLRGDNLRYSNTLNRDHYIVERADILVPAEGVDAKPFLTFTDTDDVAGLIVESGKGKVAVMSIPFETFLDASQAALLMKALLSELD